MLRNIKKKLGELFWKTKYQKAISASRLEDRFSNIFKEKLWFGNKESFSGSGSTLKNTENIRKELQSIIDRSEYESMTDVGCGDFNWMKKINFSKFRYTGIDIVKDLIDKNNELYSNENISFKHINAVEGPIPHADIILCRDVLFHLSFEDGRNLIENIKKTSAKILIATSHKTNKPNLDIRSGSFRVINLQKDPYSFPIHSSEISENHVDPDRFIGIWNVQDIKLKNLKNNEYTLTNK